MNWAASLGLPESELITQAGRIARANSGDRIDLCAIINIRSGKCGMDCAFCGQNRDLPGSVPYLISEAELLERINKLSQTPVNHIGLVASGKSLPDKEFRRLIRLLNSLPTGLRQKICLSLGHLSASQFALIKEIGIRRYHHNLETGPEYYPNLCSTQTWVSRRENIKRAQVAGLTVCSGAIFGVGESWADRASLAAALDELGIGLIPLNFLHPKPGSRLAGRKPLSVNEALVIIAFFRHLLPKATLRICGGRPITFGERQSEIFGAGADALMTGDYLTTKGYDLESDLAMLRRLKLRPAQ